MILQFFAMQTRLAVASGCLVLACSACTTLPVPDGSPQDTLAPFIAELQMRAGLARDWNLNGDMVVNYRRHGVRIKFVWQQRPTHFQLRIAGITGAILAVIDVDANGETTAMDARGNRYRTATARQMVKELLGFELPVEDFKYWLLGAPSPHSVYHAARRAGSRLVSFQQQEWQVRYQNDESDAVSWPYVKQLEITAGGVRATVTVRSWLARNRRTL